MAYRCLNFSTVRWYGHITNHLTSRKRLGYCTSHLDLWPLDLKFAPLVTLVQRHTSTKLEVSTLSYFQKIGGTGRMDGHWTGVQHLTWPPREGYILTVTQVITGELYTGRTSLLTLVTSSEQDQQAELPMTCPRILTLFARLQQTLAHTDRHAKFLLLQPQPIQVD